MKARYLSLAVLPLLLGGCYAAALGGTLATPLVGSAIRAGQKTTDVVLGSGVTPSMLAEKENLGLSINALSSKGRYVSVSAAGVSNINVFSDMISKELLRSGYQSSVIRDTVPEIISAEEREDLAADGFDMVLVGNLNITQTTNSSATLTGGEYANWGVTSFTIKGIDTLTGDILFIMSCEYGKSQPAGDVARDFSQMYNGMVTGTAPPRGK